MSLGFGDHQSMGSLFVYQGKIPDWYALIIRIGFRSPPQATIPSGLASLGSGKSNSYLLTSAIKAREC